MVVRAFNPSSWDAKTVKTVRSCHKHTHIHIHTLIHIYSHIHPHTLSLSHTQGYQARGRRVGGDMSQ